MTTYPPYWNAFNREAALASEALSSGLESLRKADYANPGLYTFAFFGLANGLERLFKIVYVIDYAVNNSGDFPNNETLKVKMGHDVRKLYEECSKLRDVDGKPYVNESLTSHLKKT